jgi:hypothetical protein
MSIFNLFGNLLFIALAVLFIYFGVKILETGNKTGGWILIVSGILSGIAALFGRTVNTPWYTMIEF